MNKNHFFAPIMRTIAVLYFIYKMAFSDPNLDWSKLIEFDNSSTGTLVGNIFIKVVFGFIFIAFLIYQFRQAKAEFSQTANRKDKLRLLSIVWSTLFYVLAALSIVNVNLDHDNISVIDYLTEFYTVSTIVGVITGIIVTIRDIKIFAQRRKNKNAQQNKTVRV